MRILRHLSHLIYGAPLLLLLFATAEPAWAQGLSARLDRILDPRTDPKQRQTVLGEVMADPAGPAALAKQGLDPRGDTEVVHAVVGALLAGSDPLAHLEPIIRLLAYDTHRAKVAARIQRAAENQMLARRAIVTLDGWALGKSEASRLEPALRFAAVRALALLPLREAVEVLVETWGKETEARALEECRVALGDVVGATAPDQARAYLRERPYASYYDLVREVARERKHEVEALSKFVHIAFRNATAREAFDALADKNPVIGARATERLYLLAEQLEGKSDPTAHLGMSPEEFAKGVFDIFVREQRNGGTPKIMALLCDTLARLARGGEKAPLRPAIVPVVELVDAVSRLAASPADWEEAGRASIRLLEEIGEPGVRGLSRFAGDSGSADVRRRAITAMRGRALKQDAGASRDFIGRQFAERLERERDSTVRNAILFAMRDAAVAQAVEPLRRLLGESSVSAGNGLSEADFAYAIEILRQIRTPESLAALLELSGAKWLGPRQRLVVATEGLVRRLNGDAEDLTILARIRALVESAVESAVENGVENVGEHADLRSGLIAQMGEAGSRIVHPLLGQLARSETLEAPLRSASQSARLRLAERLSTPPADRAPDVADLEAASVILAEEWAAGADPERLAALARAVVHAGDAAKIGAGAARYLLARLADKEDADTQVVRKLYRGAMERALDDRLPPVYEQDLLLRYRAILKKVELVPETMERFIVASRRLADLAGEEREAALGFWLDAIERAFDAKDMARGRKLADEMPKEGGLPPAVATRLEQILARDTPAGS